MLYCTTSNINNIKCVQIFPLSHYQAIFILILLGWLFVPVYHASGVFTMPEYMKKRFGHQRIRVLLSILSLIIYVLTKLSVSTYELLLKSHRKYFFLRLSWWLTHLLSLFNLDFFFPGWFVCWCSIHKICYRNWRIWTRRIIFVNFGIVILIYEYYN